MTEGDDYMYCTINLHYYGCRELDRWWQPRHDDDSIRILKVKKNLNYNVVERMLRRAMRKGV